MNAWQMNGGTVKSKGRGFIIDNKDKIHRTVHPKTQTGFRKNHFGDARDNGVSNGNYSTMPRRQR